MTAYMYDAAYSPDFNAVRARGGIAVNHYLTGDYAATSAQPAAARAAGLGVVLTYEQGTTELLTAGYNGGLAIASRIFHALPAGLPDDGQVAVYVSLDADVTNGQLPGMVAALRGVRDNLPGGIQLRLYGPGAAIAYAWAAGVTQGPGWLAAATAWAGWNPGSPGVCLVQMHDNLGRYIGTDVAGTDRNYITDPALIGAWWPDNSPWSEPMPTAQEVAAAVWSYGLHTVARDGITATSAQHPASSWLTGAAANAIQAAAKAGVAQVDAAALAAALAADLGPDLARQVADELHTRLAG